MPALCTRFGVRGFPTIKLLRPELRYEQAASSSDSTNRSGGSGQKGRRREVRVYEFEQARTLEAVVSFITEAAFTALDSKRMPG